MAERKNRRRRKTRVGGGGPGSFQPQLLEIEHRPGPVCFPAEKKVPRRTDGGWGYHLGRVRKCHCAQRRYVARQGSTDGSLIFSEGDWIFVVD